MFMYILRICLRVLNQRMPALACNSYCLSELKSSTVVTGKMFQACAICHNQSFDKVTRCAGVYCPQITNFLQSNILCTLSVA